MATIQNVIPTIFEHYEYNPTKMVKLKISVFFINSVVSFGGLFCLFKDCKKVMTVCRVYSAFGNGKGVDLPLSTRYSNILSDF